MQRAGRRTSHIILRKPFWRVNAERRNFPLKQTQSKEVPHYEVNSITMDYIFIVLAVFCFAAQFAFTKLYQRSVGQTATSSFVMLAGISVAGALIFFFAGGCHVEFSPISWMWAIIFAIVMIPYYIIGIKVLSLGSLAIYSMFMMLGGMLVPFFYGVLFLQEDISISKLVGTVLLSGFIILQAVCQKGSSEKKTQKKTKRLFFALCIVIFFINGLVGVITKAHSISIGAVNATSFTTTYCAISGALSLIILLLTGMNNRKETKNTLKHALAPTSLLIMALLGAATYGGNFLQLLAADSVPSSVQFPLVSGGVIALSALVSHFVFKEKISKIEWISVVGAFVSTFLFAF